MNTVDWKNPRVNFGVLSSGLSTKSGEVKKPSHLVAAEFVMERRSPAGSDHRCSSSRPEASALGETLSGHFHVSCRRMKSSFNVS